MEKKAILNNKIYLYLTEFFAGASVMAVELGASRLLAPYFSSSQIVWTIIIGTIMIAMALGNIFGGRSADKDPDPGRLYMRILVAAVYIAAIPVLGKYIIIGISALLIMTVNTNFLVIAAFVSCMVIFVFPLFLLGTVTPSLAKYTVGSLDDSGKTVGVLGAFNTIGSIIGTFLPTFVTIPAVGTSVTFLIFSGVLLIISLAYFISTKEKKTACIIAVILFILCTVFGRSGSFAFWENNLTYEGESIYNYLQVKENDKEVLLSTNVLFGVQSVTRKDGSLTGGMYYDYDMAAPVMAGVRDKEHSDMLILGMGTGTYARQCKRYFDGLDIEGVEIDGKITDLADRYFDADPGVPVYTYDGRAYLHVSDKKYDVIMVDAYQDISIPFQMSSVEFFREVYEHLNDDGIMVVNMNMRSDSEGNINEYLTDTIASVFPSVYTIDIPHYTNRELFASKNSDCRKRLYENSLNMSDTELTELMLDTYAGLEEKTGMDHIFTDDKAPVELLGMREIDGLIKNEVSYYRNIYDEYGLQGVLDSLGI
ncbi:MAG: fused MFS/spermidine synthase [Lachnospiraceae bacterium]|nr:fused MFS/spermidine synthase [Lachnospiraceae bacterium]